MGVKCETCGSERPGNQVSGAHLIGEVCCFGDGDPRIKYLIEHQYCDHPDKCVTNNPTWRLRAILKRMRGE